MFDEDGLQTAAAGASAVDVAGVCVSSLSDQALREFLRATDSLASWIAARQSEAIAEISRRATVEHDEGLGSEVAAAFRPEPVRLVAEEVAVELGISKTAASYRVAFAIALAQFPRTAVALESGRLDRSKADAIVDVLGSLKSDDFVEVLESAAIGFAEQHTCPQLKAWLRRRVFSGEPEAAERRRREAKQNRRVQFFAGDDGMATIHAELSAEDALAIYRTIDQVAHASCAEAKMLDSQPVPPVTSDGRTMDQRRADAFTDILLGRMSDRGVQGSPLSVHEVQVIVDAEALAGVSQAPGQLAGYGAITAQHARELAQGDARWRRVLTDAAGHVLEVSPRTYRPGRELTRFIRARDVVCRFPGCRRSALTMDSEAQSRLRGPNSVDLDHTQPFPDGATVPENLAALCRSHHVLKTHTEWQVGQDEKGVLTWTTPSGRRFFTYPHNYRSGAPPSSQVA